MWTAQRSDFEVKRSVLFMIELLKTIARIVATHGGQTPHFEMWHSLEGNIIIIIIPSWLCLYNYTVYYVGPYV